MDIYTITYCTMDQDVGANLLWHTCILLSRFDKASNKLEVVETWGFYGVPSTDTGSSLRLLKIKLGLDVDFSGNHGMLRHEEARYLDRGCGLHGATFEVTKEKFDELHMKCKTMDENQKRCIDTIAESYQLVGKPKEQSRIYPLENEAVKIYEIEKTGAKMLNRSPRLKEFRLSLFPGANTCKAQAIKLLDGILTPEQIERVTGLHRAVSRFSGPMETIHLHSAGPLRTFKKNGARYRDMSDDGVKLYWTIPPQEIETLSEQTQSLFMMHPDHVEAAKRAVRKLQRLEWLFMNAQLDEKYAEIREELIAKIKIYYESFAVISEKVITPPANDWRYTIFGLLSWPRNEEEKMLMDRIESVNDFINHFYMAIADNWGSDCDETADILSQLKEDPEGLAALLSVEKKKELCQLIGRHYVDSDECDEAMGCGVM